jgi:hypothetical protein
VLSSFTVIFFLAMGVEVRRKYGRSAEEVRRKYGGSSGGRGGYSKRQETISIISAAGRSKYESHLAGSGRHHRI